MHILAVYMRHILFEVRAKMKRFICKNCGEIWYTCDTISPISKISTCDNCGGILKEISIKEAYNYNNSNS